MLELAASICLIALTISMIKLSKQIRIKLGEEPKERSIGWSRK